MASYELLGGVYIDGSGRTYEYTDGRQTVVRSDENLEERHPTQFRKLGERLSRELYRQDSNAFSQQAAQVQAAAYMNKGEEPDSKADTEAKSVRDEAAQIATEVKQEEMEFDDDGAGDEEDDGDHGVAENSPEGAERKAAAKRAIPKTTSRKVVKKGNPRTSHRR